MATTTAAQRIAAANDAWRRSLSVGSIFANARPDGRTVMTSGVAQLPARTQLAALAAVARFDAFTRDNDPHGEHDFGALDVAGVKLFWKFDYYADASMEWGAESPADACYRVLIVMLREEY